MKCLYCACTQSQKGTRANVWGPSSSASYWPCHCWACTSISSHSRPMCEFCPALGQQGALSFSQYLSPFKWLLCFTTGAVSAQLPATLHTCHLAECVVLCNAMPQTYQKCRLKIDQIWNGIALGFLCVQVGAAVSTLNQMCIQTPLASDALFCGG